MRRPGPPALVLAGVVAFFQVVGSLGATGGQPDRRALDAVAVPLLLVGPAALAVRERWPHGAALVASIAAAVFVGRGHAYGPIFFSPWRLSSWPVSRRIGDEPGWSLLPRSEVSAPRRSSTLNASGSYPWVHMGLVAGWLAAVLAAAEVTRTRREQRAERARIAADDERRRASRPVRT